MFARVDVFPVLSGEVDGGGWTLAGGWDTEAQVIAYRRIDIGQGLISLPGLILVHHHR